MPRKSLNILVAGGYDLEEPDALDKSTDQIIEFAGYLGQEIMAQGHNLVGGCQTELDKTTAKAADNYLSSKPDEGEYGPTRIISYVLQGQKPVHEYGTIIQSDLPDWDIGGLEPTPPEVIRYADVVILIGGFIGTFKAANWARLVRKPLLPFALFGGTAKEVYTIEATRFDKAYGANIERLEYDQVLKSLTSDWNLLARKTVALAEKIVTTPNVFVVMSFKESGQYKDLYASIKKSLFRI